MDESTTNPGACLDSDKSSVVTLSNAKVEDTLDDSEDNWSDEGGDAESTREDIPQKKDIKMINIIRSFVILFMLALAIVTANSVFVYSFIQEENKFEDTLQDLSHKLINNFYDELERKLATARSLSTTFTSHAYSTGANWPFFSVPDFGAQCVVPRLTGQVSAVAFHPLVTQALRKDWELYASHFSFVAQADASMENDPLKEEVPTKFFVHHNRSVAEGIYRIVADAPLNDSMPRDIYLPIWQSSPLSGNATEVMFNPQSNGIRERALLSSLNNAGGALTDVLIYSSNRSDYVFYATPRGVLYYPIWRSLHKESVVGSLGLEFRWETFFTGVLEDTVDEAIVIVLQSGCCGDNHTFEVTGTSGALYVGHGDLHDVDVETRTLYSSDYSEFAKRLRESQTSFQSPPLSCDFRITIYASREFRQSFLTDAPMNLKLLVGSVFFFTIFVFIVYDCIIDQYQKRMVESAEKTHAIVRALFPQNVRERLLRIHRRESRISTTANSASDSLHKGNWTLDSRENRLHQTPKFRLRNVLNNSVTGASQSSDADSNGVLDEPLADLYPEASIMFGDIAGFTAWSSEREPAQVFKLLETIYGAMDKAARKLGVFKVETIGDCYVAATGLPTARTDHAEVMVRFAKMCLLKIRQLLVQLEASLGPGTGELAMRIGLHSGPVTAGILRGEKSRFQLFGDSMNTCARIESTGQKNRVHLSEEVYKCLEKAGKAHWAVPREEKVQAKGKGELQTYWLKLGSNSTSTDPTMDETMTDGKARRRHSLTGNVVLDPVLWKTQANGTDERLVEWNTDVLFSLLGNVVACRSEQAREKEVNDECLSVAASGIPLKELASEIRMPAFTLSETKRVKLSADLRQELKDYITAIASAYLRNAFHNFEHASHVGLSASKLLKRIDCAESAEGMTMEELYQHTYGIRDDALTKFAVVFSALVHDVGHTGVPNHRLAMESPDIAERYENQCIAEQRSIEAAWELLMLPQFGNLRSCLFGSRASDVQRFRQLLIKCVLATDIFDVSLSKLREDRWVKAFESDIDDSLKMAPEYIDRRATVVIEHVIQASDLSHTMQHWHIYMKWNSRLFKEMYTAFRSGRIEKDPSDGWFKGELWFFDNHVIPLAWKLKECGVFGASGDEYHTYAVRNRLELESRGEQECKKLVERWKEECV